MQVPKISIVTPSFNQGKFIEETILSVINQKYSNLEYIIMDGGSTDNSVEIIKKYQDHLMYWESIPDKGQTHAINKGFRMASGDIIAWLNSDDVYCPNTFFAVAEYFQNHPEANVVVGNMLFMDANGKVYVRKHPNISPWLEKHFMMSVIQPSTFLKKIVLSEVGFLNENYQMMMDAEWFQRISRKYPFYTINKDFSIFRWHQESKSSSNRKSTLYKRYIVEHLLVLKAAFPEAEQIIDYFPKASFYFHNKIGQLLRFLNRLFKGDLNKLKDTSI